MFAPRPSQTVSSAPTLAPISTDAPSVSEITPDPVTPVSMRGTAPCVPSPVTRMRPSLIRVPAPVNWAAWASIEMRPSFRKLAPWAREIAVGLPAKVIAPSSSTRPAMARRGMTLPTSLSFRTESWLWMPIVLLIKTHVTDVELPAVSRKFTIGTVQRARLKRQSSAIEVDDVIARGRPCCQRNDSDRGSECRRQRSLGREERY